jgi:hypothetical protein
VDIENEILAADAELHADLERLLLDHGSRQEALWGANLYPLTGKNDPGFLEFTAMINVRPSLGNKSMEIADLLVRERIKGIVFHLLT